MYTYSYVDTNIQSSDRDVPLIVYIHIYKYNTSIFQYLYKNKHTCLQE